MTPQALSRFAEAGSGADAAGVGMGPCQPLEFLVPPASAAMRRHVHSKLDDLDLDALEMAKAAARRAGLSLEEWAALVLSGRNEKPESPLPRARHAGDDLDSIIARISRTSRKQPGRDYETLMAAAAAESERQAQEHASRTTIALESMASWIEHAEERLNEAARASADQQDRIAAVLSQALSTLKDRLDTVERQVTSERPAPPRIAFPVEEAVKALSPLSETLVGLRGDVSRLAERLEQPNPAWTPAVEGIRGEIEHLRSSMEGLATRDEVAALGQVFRNLAKDLDQGRSSKDLLTLAHSVAALYQQVQTLSDDVAEGMHRRIGSEIDLVKRKIDKIAETGVDRSVIDFLSSQIVDMRQDLAHRAEPQQIARLSEDVAALGQQIADIRANQVGRGDFAALKTSLENVCSALSRTVAAQEASDVPEQLQSLSQRLDILVSRPQPEPANLDPIASQLALLTERMASLSSSRLEQGDALAELIARLSTQMQAVADREAPSQEPLMQRFDRIEQELRQVGEKADSSTIERMLRSIDEKLEAKPAQDSVFDVLEQRIAALTDRLAEGSGGALDEATAHLRNLQDEATTIAERAAKAALKDVQSNLPDAGDLDALKQGFVELKALHTRADKKTQQTLRAVHEALETLVARFPEHGLAPRMEGPDQSLSGPALEKLPPADRLEAAVRRLHAAALSQIEEVSSMLPETAPLEAPQVPHRVETGISREDAPASPDNEADLGHVRASFIAAARRAVQAAASERPADAVSPIVGQEESRKEEPDEPPQEEPSLSPSSLIERLRRTFDSHRRPLLFGLAFLILAAGSAQILSASRQAPPTAIGMDVTHGQIREAVAKPSEADLGAASARTSAQEASLFQTSSLATLSAPAFSPEPPKFLVDPQTIGEIPAEVPAPLRQAALSGDAAAVYEIAARASEGAGFARDPALALRLFERAAQAGLPPAQERLAMLHDKGVGVQRDPKLAMMWYERAALGGNIRAMHNLATLLAAGVTGKPDYAAALRWYSEAAESGLRDSQFNMGVLLARGVGTKQDLQRAFKWFSLAAAQGDADAAKKRDDLAARLAAADLTAAKEAIEQWRPRAVDPVANGAAHQAAGQTAALDRTSGNRS